MPEKQDNVCALILAAGKGTRMKSDKPKVMQNLLHRPLIYYPIMSLKEATIENIAVVVGFRGELVHEYLDSSFSNVYTVWQEEQLGTAHAVKMGQEWWQNYKHLLIVAGDTPLISAGTIKSLIKDHISAENDCSVISFDLENPKGYGRVIRDNGKIRIVEEKDADAKERTVKEVNSGVYVFNTKALASVIDNIGSDNKQNEYYLPDAIPLLIQNGYRVNSVKCACSDEFLGVNSPRQLSDVSILLKNSIINKWLDAGVKIVDCNSVWIGPDVRLGEDVHIEPSVELWGTTEVGDGCYIGSFSTFNNTTIGRNVEIVGHVRVRDTVIGNNVSVGPFVFMRDGTELKENVKVGRFVEIKKSVVGNESKVPHLSYIGDAEIGERTNIGAGTITCNYDGLNKHKTVIGNDCFVGSDTIFVAPAKVDDKATTAAGSVITKEVPSESLAIARSKQTIIKNWYSRNKKIKGGR